MTLFKKNKEGFTFIMCKHLKFFTDCGEWFVYIYIKKHCIRFSGAGFMYGRIALKGEHNE